MTRTLSITLDDDAKTLTAEGWHLFSLPELSGIAEHLKIRARVAVIRSLDDAEKKQATVRKKKPAKKAKTK